VSPEPTNDFTDLVLHVLAHVRLGGAGCVHDPRYAVWARGRAPAELERLLHEDAAVLERAWAGGRAPAVVHAWIELFGSIAALEACATHELQALSPAQVHDPAVLAGLVAADQPELELLHATLCALAPWYAGWRAAEVEPALRRAVTQVRPWLEPAVQVVPSLGGARIELAWALGPRGRGLPSRIVVGAPVPWHDLDARIPMVLAMHEQSVIDSGYASYSDAEWAALTGLAVRMREAPAALRGGHARWLASLELRPLLASLHTEGRITLEERVAQQRDPEGRAERLAALAE
jgi:hypothetical protein